MSSILKSGTAKLIFGILVIAGLFGALLVFNPGSDPTEAPSDNPDINILTRHDITIQTEMTEAFLASSYAQDLGYTTGDQDKINFLSVTTLEAWDRALSSESRAIDLAWGGGPTLFTQMADRGLLAPITDNDTLEVIEESVPESIAGAQMYQFNDQNEIVWVANAISSFGFTVNNDKLQDLGLPMPTSWQDLASPEYYVDSLTPTVSLGNPTQTTSNTRIYQIIIQKFGWEKGWEIMGRMAGNGNIYGGSVATRSAIIDGEVAVGMTIDFYGVYAQDECESLQKTCTYVIPDNGSIVNGDPIAFGINSGNPEGAKAFFEFVNSPEGQAVWVTLDRLPVNNAAFNTSLGETRPDVANLYAETLANQGITFNESLATAIEFTMQQYWDSTIGEPHPELKDAWNKAVGDLNDGTITESQFNTTVADLFEPQLTIDEAININSNLINDNTALLNTKESWFSTAQNRYNTYSSSLLFSQFADDSNLEINPSSSITVEDNSFSVVAEYVAVPLSGSRLF